MIEQIDRGAGKILGFKMSGKLHDEDYKLSKDIESAWKWLAETA